MTAYLLKSFGNSVAKCLMRASNRNGIGNTKAGFHSTAWNLQVKCTDRPPFITRLALPPDYDNVVEFMCETYYKSEPIIVNIGLESTEAPPIWRKMMHDQVKAGFSIIAEDRDHCIVGAALNIITFSFEGKKLYDLARCCATGPMRQVIEFFGYVAEKPKLWDNYCVTSIFEQASLAVSSEFQGIGVGKRLIEESWLLARDCGYRLFRLDCSSSYSTKICQGYGWEKVWSIPFSQYVKNGEIVFKNVKEPHTMCNVFVDKLRYNKTYCLPYKKSKTVTPPET